MNIKNRAARTGFAAVAMAAALAAAGPAAADIPLTPFDPATGDVVPVAATGDGLPLGTGSLGFLSPFLGTGSANPLLPPGTTGSGPGSSNCQLVGVAGCYVPGGGVH
ncbi:hypothetical protein [Nocardia sp. CDC160]|uniref:hypothetical protein n=1 Tax=Nocardia sp. CDC160 TaxID=3112166 RepID=UPI002DB83B9E|nr:hypothetical protein [Nocardia sp. CDC160]MEC3914980.1 hypothetical protein [Nocardia sp. CDC160]